MVKSMTLSISECLLIVLPIGLDYQSLVLPKHVKVWNTEQSYNKSWIPIGTEYIWEHPDFEKSITPLQLRKFRLKTLHLKSRIEILTLEAMRDRLLSLGKRVSSIESQGTVGKKEIPIWQTRPKSAHVQNDEHRVAVNEAIRDILEGKDLSIPYTKSMCQKIVETVEQLVAIKPTVMHVRNIVTIMREEQGTVLVKDRPKNKSWLR